MACDTEAPSVGHGVDVPEEACEDSGYGGNGVGVVAEVDECPLPLLQYLGLNKLLERISKPKLTRHCGYQKAFKQVQ